MRDEQPLTAAERDLLARRARKLRALSIGLGVLAGGLFLAAGAIGWTATTRRAQAGLPALFGCFVLLLRHRVAGDPGRIQDLAGSRKVVVRAPLQSISARPSRGLWVVRIEIAEVKLELLRRQRPDWAPGDEIEVHYSPAARDVLWASRTAPPADTGARADASDGSGWREPSPGTEGG